MPWALAAAAACVSLAADYACRRFHVTMLVATTVAVLAFGVAGAAGARSCLGSGRDVRRARVAVLAGAALFAAMSFAWLFRVPGAVVAALLDFGFAALAGVLGVAREARRAGRDARAAKR
jgi:hypothetical protein